MREEAISYIKDRYNEELARFTHFEEKCGRLVALLTVTIAALGGLVGFKKDNIFSPCTELDWVVLVVCLLSFFILSCAWGHSLLALKVGDCPVAAKSRDNAEYLVSASQEDSIKQIFECYVNTTSELSEVINTKAKNLEHAYNELSIGAWLVAIFSILLIGKEIFS